MIARSWRASATLAGVFALSTACFGGEYLAGVPCKRSDECGPKLACVDGVCGGGAGAGAATTDGGSGASDETEPDGSTAAATTGCGPGLVACDDDCVDLSVDGAHCGACGQPCAGACVGGECQPLCAPDEVECDGECVDLSGDFSHCGACGVACAPGELCLAGACLPSCGLDEKLCGDECVNLASSPSHCGACFSACAQPEHGASSCELGGCAYTCEPYHNLQVDDCVACGVDELLVDGPLHLWRLGELTGDIAYDAVGDAHGQYVEVALDQDGVSAPDDRAAGFGATVTSHVIAEVPDFPSAAFTVELVVRIDELVTQPIFLSLASGDDFEDGEFVAKANEFIFHHYSGADEIEGVRCTLARTFSWHTGERVDDGAWHHLAVTWTNEGVDSKLRFYIDGAWAGASVAGFAAGEQITPGTLVFGQEQDLLGGGFDPQQRLIGALDTVVIYDKKLTEARIAEHAASLLCGP